ncbi:class I SAM-dependent methyltransferase [Nosocomiicoccus sp. HMSC09A07]|uniref:class I SAM-dependent methyltransferase n=1 Tax=Nosocomiicoccus sp. HMSC09A07 TaxID=1581145 RepID=UPI0008A415FD|nr:methyltransferase [Nosocomiicoccus sp. HMSC09A07]OFS61545.1 hypothetical protein HMPREF3177_07690 [Nosocomiicoccus sp. HMSC09A07]
MSHYYTTDDTPHDFKEIKYNIKGKTYTFTTDRGVFSKDRVDFGTDVLLNAVLEDYDGPGYFIDMGAGYGPVSIVLADHYGGDGVAVEVNEDAISVLDTNMHNNNVSFDIVKRELYDDMELKADLYVTNPPFRAGKDTVLEIINDSYERLVDHGAFYMVVQKKQGMPSYLKHLETLYGNVEKLKKSKGYYILKSIKHVS